MDVNPTRSNIREERSIRVGLTGTGAADPTKRAGPGVTVTRTGVGVFKFSFASEDPRTFVGMDAPAFRADTPSAVKGYSASAGVYTAPSGTTPGFISVSIWDASNNAVELAALQYIDVTFRFSGSAVIT